MYRSKLRSATSSAAPSAPLRYREIGCFAPAARPARDQRATLVAGHRRCSAPRRRCRPAVSLPLRVLGFVFELGLRVQEERRYSQCFRAAAATASLVEGINQARGALNSRRCAGQMPALAALLLSSQPGRVLEVHFCSLAAMLAVVELCWSGGDLCCQNSRLRRSACQFFRGSESSWRSRRVCSVSGPFRDAGETDLQSRCRGRGPRSVLRSEPFPTRAAHLGALGAFTDHSTPWAKL